jgi:hypothetical protein
VLEGENGDFGGEKGIGFRGIFAVWWVFLVFWVPAGASQTCIFVSFLVSGGVLRLDFVVEFFNIL